ncbi:DUF1877 domain-containing protein [Streptomyces sp. NPDC056468]|uniref:DUF1877 domain-containing protein n=1 Tax=Streptomyces sp. NPDC056468 TaxID=3345830 RepID=UPI0036AEA1AC
MALTQQFARVTPAYLERCRISALDSPGAAPGWDPPPGDLLDTDWAIRGLIRYCRATGTDADLIALLDRAVSGDPGGDIGFLDHDEVYDGIEGPPRLLAAAAVAEIARALYAVDLDHLLTDRRPTPRTLPSRAASALNSPVTYGPVLSSTSPRCGSSTAAQRGAGNAWSCGSTDRPTC